MMLEARSRHTLNRITIVLLCVSTAPPILSLSLSSHPLSGLPSHADRTNFSSTLIIKYEDFHNNGCGRITNCSLLCCGRRCQNTCRDDPLLGGPLPGWQTRYKPELPGHYLFNYLEAKQLLSGKITDGAVDKLVHELNDIVYRRYNGAKWGGCLTLIPTTLLWYLLPFLLILILIFIGECPKVRALDPQAVVCTGARTIFIIVIPVVIGLILLLNLVTRRFNTLDFYNFNGFMNDALSTAKGFNDQYRSAGKSTSSHPSYVSIVVSVCTGIALSRCESATTPQNLLSSCNGNLYVYLSISRTCLDCRRQTGFLQPPPGKV
jgi:hypothetical protein